MEIKRLKNNQIRCALTEQEIEEMGFSIDDIIGNTENTQKFMRLVLERVEEQEQINTELLSPMVRAELLQDHTMTITFGGITEEEKQGMLGCMMDLIEQLAGKAAAQQKKQQDAPMEIDDIFQKSTPFAAEFLTLEDAILISKVFCGKECIPESSLYKLDGKFYLIMDFKSFSKKALRPIAFAAVEYDNHHFVGAGAIAHIKEHGTCLIVQDAIAQLMQL